MVLGDLVVSAQRYHSSLGSGRETITSQGETSLNKVQNATQSGLASNPNLSPQRDAQPNPTKQSYHSEST
ncbi:hypothetical protein CEE69_16130 [Rhodopirellula bahusiensis]|uniref:Uncharacterized protein n=1 Tax=Rhodopirellula bahusiensis TaxID=2014065 RepID=A0A2G1W560_9BACT|nr:hypothetical protein CEE69_16130 [Rhodopirellula bahusiensis]